MVGEIVVVIVVLCISSMWVVMFYGLVLVLGGVVVLDSFLVECD